MDFFRKTLIGALVGLARATEGNEHLITPDSTAAILDCLSASLSDEAEYRQLLGRVEEAKRKMVPDCFLCANPCGRTSAYDLRQIGLEPSDVQEVKAQILEKLLSIPQTPLDEAAERCLYRGLICLGLEGYTGKELHDIFFDL